jgi:hypothetical protein
VVKWDSAISSKKEGEKRSGREAGEKGAGKWVEHECLQTALSQYADQYQELHLAATWLQKIANILEPPADQPVTGKHIAQKLRTYLDGLLQTDLSPPLETFC